MKPQDDPDDYQWTDAGLLFAVGIVAVLAYLSGYLSGYATGLTP